MLQQIKNLLKLNQYWVKNKMIKIILALTLSLLITTSYAAEKSELVILSEKYDEIKSSIVITQQRLLTDSDKYEKNELDYSKLESVYSNLSESQVQIDSIESQLFISGLITDTKLKAHANKYIRVQKGSISKQLLRRAEFCEKTLTNIKSSEASLLILQARDILKESAKILEH